MNAETREYLRAVNRRFYDHFAEDFSDTRQRAWPGWLQVKSHFSDTVSANTASSNTAPPLTVLDIGCGNGRFASFLSTHWGPNVDYLGLDGSAELLHQAEARSDGLEAHRFFHADLISDNSDALLGDRCFQLVALFGVLHHVPDQETRRNLLRRLTARLAPGGLLAVSIWRLDRTPNFSRKIIPWSTYRSSLEGTSESALDLDLEPGDALLSWAGQVAIPRYCHFPDDAEIADWIKAVKVPVVDRFAADGPSGQDNLYLLFRMPRDDQQSA